MATEVKTPTKTFTGIKIEQGICIVNKEITYGMHVSGVLSPNSKSAFSVLSTTTEDAENDIHINTYLYVLNDRKQVSELVESGIGVSWFFGKSKTPSIPADISESVRVLIKKDLNKHKGILKASFIPVSAQTPEDIQTIMEALKETGKLEECIEFAKQLDLELAKDKKASASVGLDDFIERYAFKEHILLAGPAGGKFFHAPIAA